MITPVSRVRTCIIGAGASARQHIAGWQAVNDSQVVAIVDLDETRAHKLAEEFGIATVSTNYVEVLGRADINIVSLCTPTAMHGPIGLDAVKHHKHVFCERGITHALSECDTLLTTAQRNRVAVGMSFPRRYQPSFVRIREMLDEGMVGRPVMYRVHCLLPAIGNTRDRSRPQGMQVFLDYFADHYDVWTWLFRSEVVKVTARGFSWGELQSGEKERLGAAPDTGVALMEFGSGDIAVITTSCGLPYGFDAFQVHEEELIGPQGVVSEIQAAQFTHVDPAGRGQAHGFQSENTYAEAIRDFAGRVRRGEPPRVAGEDGKRALRIGLAVCESIDSGGIVEP